VYTMYTSVSVSVCECL